MKDLITIIIPVYNVEQYLNRCVDSIINQTYNNLEIILVDDGSTDNSGKICDEYALKDKRIKVIHKENAGVSLARNAGIDVAKGEYIGFIDSDDYIEPDMYEYLYNLMIENNSDISCCNNFDIVNNKCILSTNFPREGVLSLNEILEDSGWGFTIVTKLFNKKTINNIRFDRNLAIGEDFLFCFEVFKNSKKIIFKNKAKYYYYHNQNSVMQKKVFNKKYLGVITLFDNIIDYAKNNNLNSACKNFIKHKLRWIIDLLAFIAEDENIDNNKDSLCLLLKYARKNLHYIVFCKIAFFRKCFFVASCINFNLASKIYKILK